MIDRIAIENFKSLRHVDLKLGRMNLFIGANASGKSNFLDALRVLQGIGNGFTISEVFDGKPAGATSVKWEEIRGRSTGACFTRKEAGSTITQIVATTHSATVLDWLSEEVYKTTFFCKRDEETGESRIRALADVPRFLEVVKETAASELFAEGWLEAAL